MARPTVGEQEYLDTLLRLAESGEHLNAAAIARSMHLSAPTVHEMVKRLIRDGLIERDARKTITFTPTGLEFARDGARRHRIIERFLTDALGIPWHEVHAEAEKIDRTASENVVERMREAIGPATTCPHGHPLAAGERVRCGGTLADVEAGTSVTVLRVEDEGRSPDVADVGMRPGLRAEVMRRDDDRVTVRTSDGEDHEVPADIARTLTVWTHPGGAQAPAAGRDSVAA